MSSAIDRELDAQARDLPWSATDDPTDSIFRTDRSWQLVRSYDAIHSDGHEAKVYCMRLPAVCWRVRGGGVDISTGSGYGVAELVHNIAQAIAGGMLGACIEEAPRS